MHALALAEKFAEVAFRISTESICFLSTMKSCPTMEWPMRYNDHFDRYVGNSDQRRDLSEAVKA